MCSVRHFFRWSNGRAAACILLLVPIAAGALSLQTCRSHPPGLKEWFYEHEFAQYPTLAAAPHQTVVLHLAPGEQAIEHAIPYRFSQRAVHLFGIEADDLFITHAELYDRKGAKVLSVQRGDGGIYQEIGPGTFYLKVYHDGSAIPSDGTVAFIRSITNSQTMELDEAGTAGAAPAAAPNLPEYPTFGVLQTDWGKGQDGGFLLLAVEPYGDGFVLQEVDYSSADVFANKYHLFSFGQTQSMPSMSLQDGDMLEYRLYALSPSEQQLMVGNFHISCAGDNNAYCPASANHPQFVNMPGFTSETTGGVFVEDQGGDNFTLWFVVHDDHCVAWSPIFFAENSRAYFANTYPNCLSVSGKSPAYFELLDGVRWYRTQADLNAREMAAGEVALYGSSNYQGVVAVLSAPMDQLQLLGFEVIDSLRFGFHTLTTASFAMKDGTTRIVGIDTPKLGISIAELQSISTFQSDSKFVISSKGCPYCNLAGVDLSGKVLDQPDLVFDLSHANLLEANLKGCSLKKANLSYAVLGGAILDNINLDGANLSNALLNGQTDTFGNHIPAASARGAFLRNVNLQYADISGVDFSNANLYGTVGSGPCYPQSGFTSKCACASHTTINAATFKNAYLANLDMSNAVITGGDFSDAILCGANLTNATLQLDDNTGQRVMLTGAFLQGVNFTNARVNGVNLSNAYVNLSGELCLVFWLSSFHVDFPGFWASGATGGCPIASISDKTNKEGLSTSNLDFCPDTNLGPCSEDERWANPSGYVSPQLFGGCYDNPPVCQGDWNWLVSGN